MDGAPGLGTSAYWVARQSSGRDASVNDGLACVESCDLLHSVSLVFVMLEKTLV